MRETLVIIKWTLWQKRWFLLWWGIAIVGLIALNLVFYPTFKDQADQINESLSRIPESAKAFTTDTGEYASPVGYLSSQVFYLMLPMLLSIMSISLGSSLLAKEEKEGTIELLLSRKLSRAGLIIGKACSAILLVFAATLIGGLTTIILGKVVGLEVAAPNIAMATLYCFLMALGFGFIAYAITSLGKARVASIGIATLVGLGGYIIASLASLATWLKTISKLFPFNYYKPAEILHGNFSIRNLLILAAVPLVALGLSVIAFRRRDVAS